MTEWFDYLDKCWSQGYAAYERAGDDRVHQKEPSIPDDLDGDDARKAYSDGWQRAKLEYETVPPDEE